jgi:AraC-like DNA-binding protein
MPPAPGRDLLTEVLGLLHLRGELFCRSTFTAPWRLRFPARPEAYFRFVETGACWIVPEDGREPVLLRQGDLALLPHGHGHGLCDDPRSALASPDCFRRAQGGPEYCEGPAWGGGGAASRVLCGVFHLERPEGHPLFRCMPPLIHLSADRTPPGMEALLALMAEEAKAARPGVQAIVTRLLEAVFIQALRAWTSTPCACGKEWLAALDDPPVYAALDLIHQAPEQPWTVASLSERVGLSRSPFAARFSGKVGLPPLAYLTQWRMRVAARLLRERNLGLAQVSARVGYASEAAFSRAFKQQFGLSPGAYRREGGVPELPRGPFPGNHA